MLAIVLFALIEETDLEMTCQACPSQWEGVAPNGERLFIHYRYGYLSVKVNEKEFFGKDVGDSLGGVMSYDEMLGHVRYA